MKKIFFFVSISLSLYANNFKLAYEAYKAKYYNLAITLLEKECNNNNSKACSNLANFYYEGKIVQKNIELS
jgi:TPR repeat protein